MAYYLLRIAIVLDIICNFSKAISYSIVIAKSLSYLDGPAFCRFFISTILISDGVSIKTLWIISLSCYFGNLFSSAKITIFEGLSKWYNVLWFHNHNTRSRSCYLILSTTTLFIIPALALAITYGKIIN